MGFAAMCQLASPPSALTMRFLSVASHLLHSGFLRTAPRGTALAFGSWFCLLTMSPSRYSHRGLAPHKFAPMLGAHKPIEATPYGRASWAALETMLPITAVRAVHPGRRGVEQIVPAVAVPVIPADVHRTFVPAALKRASRALHPHRADWRYRHPLVFAGQAHSRAAKVRRLVCSSLCEIYHRHGF